MGRLYNKQRSPEGVNNETGTAVEGTGRSAG